MTTVLPSQGKYRPRKEWSTNSIPTLVSLEEETSPTNGAHNNNAALPPKAPRRSSLAIGLMGGRSHSKGDGGTGNSNAASDKPCKRRSSIAVSFLGRHSKNKDASYEVAMISEKTDCTLLNDRSPLQSRSLNIAAAATTKWYGDDEQTSAGNGRTRKCSAETPRNDDDNDNDNNDDHNNRRNDDNNRSDGDDQQTGSEDGDNNATDGGGFVVLDGSNLSPPQQQQFDDDSNVSDKEKRRRSSWQAKMDRRRRKGMMTSAASIDDDTPVDLGDGNTGVGGGGRTAQQKRNSWWNIFVPDNLKQSRPRRASTQDGISLGIDSLPPRPFRSKSRSVDHGLAAPYDLDSLRSKVEGRFDSVERLTKDGRHKGSMPTIPTKSYTVGNRDTLTSVAARFDTTPSELTGLNKLNSSFIYPGQLLLVPDKSAAASVDGSASDGTDGGDGGSATGGDEKQRSDEIPQDEKELLDGLRPGSPKPGHIERVATPNAGAAANADPDDPVITQRFLKINVRHITDGQGVVGGVLLVTPNAVMFDPNVSDPLVIEHGPESYGVIAPMELVVNAAIFHDIAHMRVCGEPTATTSDKVEIYYPKMAACNRCETSHSPGKDSLLVKDETFPELGLGGSVEGCDDGESVCSSNDREGDAFPKAFERDLVTPTNLQKAGSTEAAPDAAGSAATTTAGGAAADTKEQSKNANAKSNADETSQNDLCRDLRTLEERRKSLLDHHWAVPSKDRSIDDDAIDSSAASNVCTAANATTASNAPTVSVAAVAAGAVADQHDNTMSKQSCHDSGIDIRDPLPAVQAIPTKKNYSDADIVLSSDWVPPLTIAPTVYTETLSAAALSAQNSVQSHNLEVGGRKKTSSVSFSVDDDSQSGGAHGSASGGGSTSSDKTADKKNKMLKRLSYPLTWVEGFTGDGKPAESVESAPNTGDSGQSVFSKVFSRRSSIGTFMRPHSSEGNHAANSKPQKAPPPKLDYRSMVSIDDMPELFVSFDKLIPRPARACPDPPLYLRLRMGRPVGKTMPLPTSVMSYGKNKLRPEFWFSVPKNRTDELYRFINTWVPHLYGELDEEQIAARGFELIQHDTEWVKGTITKDGRTNSEGEDITELTRESWEVLSMSTDDYRKASLFATNSFDLDFPIPDLIGTTEILTEEHREKLCGHLPARAEGYSWSLVFSTSQHGFSLNSLYRKMQRLESPVLVVIQDTENNVFGALTSCALHVSDLFYGTGESLLFKFNPSFKVFHWTGENLYFIKGNPESLSIGAGDGKFGLWLDGDLNQGRSQRCSTYANEPLAPQEDFVMKTLECWAFV